MGEKSLCTTEYEWEEGSGSQEIVFLLEAFVPFHWHDVPIRTESSLCHSLMVHPSAGRPHYHNEDSSLLLNPTLWFLLYSASHIKV